jgi:hypothetical protein
MNRWHKLTVLASTFLIALVGLLVGGSSSVQAQEKKKFKVYLSMQ